VQKTIFYLILLCVSFSCRKKTQFPEEASFNTGVIEGLPPTQEINGYLYSSTSYYTPGDYYFTTYSSAAFAEPARKLLKGFDHGTPIFLEEKYFGNVDVKTVTHNDTVALKRYFMFNSGIRYEGHTHNVTGVPQPPPCRWQIEGNYGFKPHKVTIPSTYPVVKSSNIPDTVSRSQGFAFSLEGFKGYDSLVVFLGRNVVPGGIIASRRFTGIRDSIRFMPEELSPLEVGPERGWIQCLAYKYFHQTVNNKLYVYELGTVNFTIPLTLLP
jgi:hypothetical protein